MNKTNDTIMMEYFEAMQIEINPSTNYVKTNRNTLDKLLDFHINKLLTKITREDIMSYLKWKKLDRLDSHLSTSHVPSSNNRTDLSHWKGRPVIALEDWIQIRDLPSRLEYFPDDFDQLLTYVELPYYQYEFERKKRRL